MTDGSTLSFPIVVEEFARNSREVIRVSLDEFQGRKVLSIRAWYRLPDGSINPGRDGLTLSVHHLSNMADGICEAYRTACALRMISPDGEPTK